MKALAESLLAALLGIAVGGGLMSWWGFDPIKAYSALFEGAVGDLGEVWQALGCLLSEGWRGPSCTDKLYHLHAIATTLANATPLILTGLTFAIGIRAGLFNIGAQGQVFTGAMAAVAASLVVLPGGLSWIPGLHVMISLVFAMIAGALWSLPVALLKATRGVHEVISTIMLNWVGWYLALYLTSTALVDPNRAEKTISVVPAARLEPFFAGTDLAATLFVSVLFALMIYWILWHTTLGYEIRAVGLNPDASRYGGMRPALTLSAAMILGGMAAGLAGATQILGRPPTYALYNDLSNVANLGFDGIAVALIGRNHPLGVIAAAVFMGGLAAGSNYMQIMAKVPLEMVRVVQGAIILALAVPGLLNLFKFYRGRGR